MADTFDLQNGLLSFSNPNYNLASPDLNSNEPAEEEDEDEDDDPFDELYEELDAVCRFSRKESKVKTRRSYAQLGIQSMGVDTRLENEPLLLPSDRDNNLQTNGMLKKSLEGSLENNNNPSREEVANDNNHKMGRKTNGFLDYYISLEAATRQHKKDAAAAELQNCPNNNHKSSSSRPSSPEGSNKAVEEIPHIHGELTNDLYAVPVKRRDEDSAEKSDRREKDVEEEEEPTEFLPPGWERHEDDDGPYYWHISTGTIQREPPPSAVSSQTQAKRISRDLDVICNFTNFAASSKSSSVSSSSSSDQSSSRTREEKQLKRRSYPQGKCSIAPDKKPIRFAVRSLGWVEIAEEDLTPERSSKAVNKCIVDLSLGRNDIMDVVGRWGDGKDLYMDLDDYCLQLMNPQDMTILNTQPIHSIRVWGVGRDNGRERDFAYVARDRPTRKHMCHVFRCDIPARIIANTLRDICKKIMIERSLQQNLAQQVVPRSFSSSSALCLKAGAAPARPTHLPTEQHRSAGAREIFPTPMEEPRKVLRVHYLGSTQVTKPTGMETLNIAIDRLVVGVPRDEYKFVNVAVAPSTITIIDPAEEGKILAECRVRFLSFLGIGRNVKQCAFIVHTAQDHYIAYVFHCEPSSGALCKTIEAACKLRYQKCLDAHKQVQERRGADGSQQKKIGTTIRNVFGTITTRLTKTAET